MNSIIEVQGLTKSYGDIKAVKGIDFNMKEGSLFAFLGPNGAGKSTSIHMITTFLKADAGRVMINGYELGKEDHNIRKSIGAVFQDGLLDDMLSVKENLYTRGSLYGMDHHTLKSAVERVLQACELQDIFDRRYGTLSGGQKRRADIARALLHSPKLLFLDEPTTGLDPKTRATIWNVIKRLQKEEGMSVFLTTHYMEEAKDADHVVVLKQGEIEASGTPGELKRSYAHDVLRLYASDLTALKNKVSPHEYIEKTDFIELSLSTTLEALSLLTQYDGYYYDFEVIHGTMDDAFLAIIGEELTK